MNIGIYVPAKKELTRAKFSARCTYCGTEHEMQVEIRRDERGDITVEIDTRHESMDLYSPRVIQ